jgi:hypothetical protein
VKSVTFDLTKAACWGIALVVASLAVVSSASAATVSGSVGQASIAVGESTAIQIRLDLAGGEEASIFDGRFDLIGSATVVEEVLSSDLTAGGPSWTSAFGGVVAEQVQLSLTSANAGGSRLVATLTVTGLSAGTFLVELGAGNVVRRDLPVPPFIEDVPLTTPVGTVLAAVTVLAPLPALGGPGIAALVCSVIASWALVVRGRAQLA